MFTPYFYISDYSESLHISPNAAFGVLSALNAGGVVGRVAPAWLSDKIGRFNLLCPSAFLSGLLCLVFWMFAKDLVAIMIFAVLYGVLSGAFISVVTPCVAQISDIREIGTRIGALYTLISVPCVSFRSSRLSLFLLTHPGCVSSSQFTLWGPDRRRTDPATTWVVHSQHRTCGIKHDTWFGASIDIKMDDRPAISVSGLDTQK